MRSSTEASERRTIATATAIAGVGVLPAFLCGGLAVRLRADLGFGADGLGAAVAAFFTASALGSAVLGRLVERTGARSSMRAAAAVSACVLLGVGLAAGSWTALAALLFVGGLANAAAHPATHLFLAEEVRHHRQGLAFGVKQAAIPAATLAAGLAATLAGLLDGWRGIFVVAAAAALAAAAGVPLAGAAPAPRRPRRTAPGIGLALPALAIGLGTAAAVSVGAFLVDAGVAAGLRETVAGALLMGASAAGLAGRVFAGWLADRRGGRHLRAVALTLVGGAGGFVLLAAASGTWLFAAGALLAYGVGWSWPGVFMFAVVRAFPDTPAAATGVTQTGAFLGSGGGALLFGVVAAGGSYDAAWMLSAGLALAAAAAMVASRPVLRPRAPTAEPARLAELTP